VHPYFLCNKKKYSTLGNYAQGITTHCEFWLVCTSTETLDIAIICMISASRRIAISFPADHRLSHAYEMWISPVLAMENKLGECQLHMMLTYAVQAIVYCLRITFGFGLSCPAAKIVLSVLIVPEPLPSCLEPATAPLGSGYTTSDVPPGIMDPQAFANMPA
jgi:hypothetical protein